MSALIPAQRRLGEAIRLVDTTKISRDEWLKYRKLGVGASEAGTAVGLNKYQTPYQLYRVKVGLDADVDLSENQKVQWGLRLEDAVAEQWAAETGHRVERVNSILQSAEHPHMLCNLDRRVVGEEAVLEVKTAGQWAAIADQWGESGTDAVPLHYLMQVTHQLVVTGYKTGYLGVLIGGQEFRHYVIKRDNELVAELIRRESEFWRRVLAKDPPPAANMADLALAFPRHVDASIEATAAIAKSFYRFYDLRAEAKEIETEMDLLKLEICSFMGEHDALVASDQAVMATWRRSKDGLKFDSKKHAKDQPDCHAAFSDSKPGSRTFLVKDPE